MSATDVRVPTGLHWQTRFFASTRSAWVALGKLETAAVADEIANIDVELPVYVTSLPRSGTTIVTEMLERHPMMTSHRYSDFPNCWTPYWRNYLLQKTRSATPQLAERAHQDRIRVSNDSPEAVEELLWMHFFPDLHDESQPQVLDGSHRNTGFDAFYRDHIRKLLAVRSARRYLAKGNYNVARIGYLLSLFPDARFLVPVRKPVDHIASLVKQQRLFSEQSRRDARIPLQLALSGHFEFGPGRRRLHLGNADEAAAIDRAWSEGREVEGWARYWAMTYRHLLQTMEDHPGADQACLLFGYEALCDDSASQIDRLLRHCALPEIGFEATRHEYIGRLSRPDYYCPDFSDEEHATIDRHCSALFSDLSERCINPH